jgi:hypothetical protein
MAAAVASTLPNDGAMHGIGFCQINKSASIWGLPLVERVKHTKPHNNDDPDGGVIVPSYAVSNTMGMERCYAKTSRFLQPL